MKIAAFCGVFALAGHTVAQAQSPAAGTEEDKTVAIVNGHEIKISEIQLATEDIVIQLPDLPPKLRYPFVVEYLMQRHLLAQQAVKEGVADTAEYKRRLALYQAKALRDAYFEQFVKPKITEDMVKAAYDEEVTKLAPVNRYRARHILIAADNEKLAKDIVVKLKAGEKFEDLAKQYSIDGSKDYGGDLGYFTVEEMVPEFSEATAKLKIGEVSVPVKTSFGWHIIKLEDIKTSNAQPYDQVKGAIRDVLLRKQVQEMIDRLRTTAKIEIIDKDLEKYALDSAAKARELQQQQQGMGGADGAAAQPATAPEAAPATAPAPAAAPAPAPAAAPDAASGKGDLAPQ